MTGVSCSGDGDLRKAGPRVGGSLVLPCRRCVIDGHTGCHRDGPPRGPALTSLCEMLCVMGAGGGERDCFSTQLSREPRDRFIIYRLNSIVAN